MHGDSWLDVIGADDVAEGTFATVKVEGNPILIRHDVGDTWFAIDNRCPHEGYPLSQGEVKDGLLTCAWHNWKFRLTDGVCVLGGEDVRRYPVEVRGERVFLDVTPPPVGEQVAKLERSLERAFHEDDWSHAAREVERLRKIGQTPTEILAFGCRWSAERSRYGFDHGLATAADYAALAERLPELASEAVLEALHGMVHVHLRRQKRAFASTEPIAAEPDSTGWAGLGLTLRRRIEAEDVEGAQALLRGAIADGIPQATILGWLAGAATDHFLNFGHGQIYVVKADELLDAIGFAHAHPVLTSLVTRITLGTREDTLPYMREYRNLWPTYAARLEGWAHAERRDSPPIDVAAFVDQICSDSLATALDAVAAALDAGLAPDRIAALLGLAAARRLWRFDASIAERDDVSEDWLWITHQLTYADAVRESLLRWPSADTLRGLFFSARFIQHTHVLEGAVGDLDAASENAERAASDLQSGLASFDPARATRGARYMLSTDVDAFEGLALRGCLETPLTLPIFVQHHVKTVLAAQRLTDALRADALTRESGWELPWMGVTRFLAHRHRERRLGNAVRIARDFVQDGKMRGNLLGY